MPIALCMGALLEVQRRRAFLFGEISPCERKPDVAERGEKSAEGVDGRDKTRPRNSWQSRGPRFGSN